MSSQIDLQNEKSDGQPKKKKLWRNVGTVAGITAGYVAGHKTGLRTIPFAPLLGGASAGYIGRKVGQSFDKSDGDNTMSKQMPTHAQEQAAINRGQNTGIKARHVALGAGAGVAAVAVPTSYHLGQARSHLRAAQEIEQKYGFGGKTGQAVGFVDHAVDRENHTFHTAKIAEHLAAAQNSFGGKIRTGLGMGIKAADVLKSDEDNTMSKDDAKPHYLRAAGRGIVTAVPGMVGGTIVGGTMGALAGGRTGASIGRHIGSAVGGFAGTVHGRYKSYFNQAKKAGQSDDEAHMSAHHLAVNSTIGDVVLPLAGGKIANNMTGFKKSDGENTMSNFAKEPLIKFFAAIDLKEKQIPGELVKVSSIQSFIQSQVSNWETKAGAKEAVEYFEGDNGLRKAVYLDMYDNREETMQKSDTDNGFLPDLAQYAEVELNKAHPKIVDVSMKTTSSSTGAMNGDSGTPASGVSSSYGNPTPPSPAGVNPKDVGAQQAISTTPQTGDPALTTRGGKGRLVANYAAAFKQAKANPINISPSSTDNPFQKPSGVDLDTTGGTSLTRAEGATDLQKSIAATIADRLRAHADDISAAVQNGSHVIRDAAGRLNKSSFAGRIRGSGPKLLTGAGVAAAATGVDVAATTTRRDSTTNPAND